VIFGILEVSYINGKNSQSELKSLISKGMAFYTPDVIKNFNRIDSYWLFKEVAKHTKNESMLSNESRYDNDPFVRLLNKDKQFASISSWLPGVYPYTLESEYKSIPVEPVSGILLKALYCDVVGYNDFDFSVLQIFNHKDGTVWDTHFLFGLLLLKNNGCYRSDEIEKSIKQVVAEIVSAEKNDKVFSDIYAERIVMLYWAGYGQNVEKQWIDIVKDNFTKDPGWRESNLATYSSSHTTGLSMLSLIYYLEAKPLQNLW
jgi:hypothetical protein